MKTTMGMRIREARLAKNMTQKELAQKIKCAGHPIISDYERGKRGTIRPNIALLIAICAALDISIDWLFLGKKEKPSKKKQSK